MPAWEHNCVLCCGVADDALSLSLISNVCSSVVDTVDVIQVEYGVVVL